MKIGYPCINLSFGQSTTKTFRLASYTEERMHECVQYNLQMLLQILEFNKENGLLFFRITSDLIPFGSHIINTFQWQTLYKNEFNKIGQFIKENNMRISMHPGQYTLLNSLSSQILEKSIAELQYHENILSSLGLDDSHKIQIHVGGVYNEKHKSMERFINVFHHLPVKIQKRLVIENDDHLYSLQDCLFINESTKIPILFDVFHHSLFNNNESMIEGLQKSFQTWDKIKDSLPMIDYASQENGKRIGTHATHVELDNVLNFFAISHDLDFDMMLEIKDKDISALEVLQVAKLNCKSLLI